MIYEIAWEKKLELADGDLDKLAWLCCPDFSDIKKKNHSGGQELHKNKLIGC